MLFFGDVEVEGSGSLSEESNVFDFDEQQSEKIKKKIYRFIWLPKKRQFRDHAFYNKF